MFVGFGHTGNGQYLLRRMKPQDCELLVLDGRKNYFVLICHTTLLLLPQLEACDLSEPLFRFLLSVDLSIDTDTGRTLLYCGTQQEDVYAHQSPRRTIKSFLSVICTALIIVSERESITASA